MSALTVLIPSKNLFSLLLYLPSMSDSAILHSLSSTGGRPNQIQAIRNAVIVWDRRAWRAAQERTQPPRRQRQQKRDADKRERIERSYAKEQRGQRAGRE